MFDNTNNSSPGVADSQSLGQPHNSLPTTSGFAFNPPTAPAAPTASDDPALDEIASSSDNSDNDQHDSNPVTNEPLDNDKDDLTDIKNQALKQLQPLVNKLDQTPEEKFKTTMMMIQASDDKGLIPDAYKAAQDIKDEKERAQALLDVVNEINYFHQNNA